MLRKTGLFFTVMMLLFTVILIGTVVGAGIPSFKINLNASQVTIGDNVVVAIQGNNVTDLYGYEAVLTYNADLLEFNSTQSNGSFEGYKIAQDSGNQVTFACTKMGNKSGENGDLAIGTLTFKAKKNGQANITLKQMTTMTSQELASIWNVNAQAAVKIDGTIPGPGSGRGGGGGGSSTPPTKEDPNLYVAKESELRIETAQDGQTSVIAVIDSKRLAQKLTDLQATSGSNVLSFEIPGEHDLNALQLPLPTLFNSLKEHKDTILSVRSHLGTYDLPMSILNQADFAGKAGVEGATLIIRIDKAKSLHETKFDQSISDKGMVRVSDMIDYKVILKTKDKEEEIHSFGNSFVTRVILVDEMIQDPSAATAVVYDPATGEMKFVPSVFTVKGGKTEVKVIRNSNSMYAIVQNKKTFDDMIGHWAQQEVEQLASKMIINGTSDRTYTPEMQITRAQFAALLVRGLGLPEEAGLNVFTDVADTQWYAPEVNTAAKYGLVQGVAEGQFNPDAQITREQMVVMMMKAIGLVKGTSASGASVMNASFADQDLLSDYARNAVADAAGKGLIHGKTETTFAPQDVATRAEAAVIIKRVLQYANLIN
ncbi:S-layer homology domain-containing protein [Paenibacillus radicis (ex Xue et al. 2023)]|uniref:S-layer homology domain-containing protein n=1 Tax=Paenibacillus radicis (ex Xue et al. 2023) TaxID=2972489 RepID=A0ABT1YHU9_9BACL|nr:S-layer homology domain-containing protein [Paenibacillus radicis (ex Xue et al. 2023)]MCR8632752.1 S-layer homology domain-containing protein [Paenibacillus radicis (ex Xue et al. 2023)]